MFREVDINSSNPFLKKIEYVIDDIAVGHLKYQLIYDKMEIDDLFVEEEYRNKQIGTKLLSYLVSVAIENRVVNITLEVRLSNEIARDLYKRFGFREVALRRFYYGNEDGVLMEKHL